MGARGEPVSVDITLASANLNTQSLAGAADNGADVEFQVSS